MTQTAIKNEILARIKAGKPEPQPLPEPPAYPYAGDPVKDFIARLIGFDGRAIEFATREKALAWLASQSDLDAAKRKIYSSVADVKGNMENLANLRDAADIEVCVTEGEHGVGETGSIWVTNKSLRHAVTGLLARKVYVLLDAAKIVGALAEAYEKINLRDAQYGSFFSGPSATADIEAVHITGAQGPLALTAVVYNLPNAPAEPELQVNPNAETSRWRDDF